MTSFIKLCGLSTLEDIEIAAALGVDAVGIVMSPSVRQVDVATAKRLVGAVPEGVLSVGVFFRPPADLVRMARDEIGFDWMQAETENLRAIEEITPFPVVHDGESLSADVLEAFELSVSRRILVESTDHGGMGTQADWERVAKLGGVANVVLAGGLNAQNVSEAIELVRPGGVDVSSGIESTPGVKDHALMKEFVDMARRTNREVAR